MSFANNFDLPQVLLRAGVKVSEYPNWKTRGRGILNIKGIICHHTASQPGKNAPSLGTVVNGRSDLPGPLCQILLGRDGTAYIIAAGRANHAGRGLWHGISNGNGNMLGIEAENSGVGEPWPDKQVEAYVQICAAICRWKKFGAEMVAGHKEYCLPKGRKIDPAGINMVDFRLKVAQIIGGDAPKPEPIVPVDDQGRETLRRGDSGEDVKTVQKAVGAEPIDGQFGAKTESKVREFQRQHQLVADGIVGPRTWSIIVDILHLGD
jgi:N-acetyl-anhydromuramyl-L-alanine amidase AmpD